ncbi:MAG: hypothetical protein ACO4AM_05200 [Candidatus Nanopelagicaceae bacterium]
MIYFSTHFNRPDLVEIQKKCIDRIGGELFIAINGGSREIINECRRLGISYQPMKNADNPSVAHAKTLNWALRSGIMRDGGFLIDHDCFPVAVPEFSQFVGVEIKAKHTMLLPSYLGFTAEMSEVMRTINMMPADGYDTSWMTYKIIKKYDVKYLTADAMDRLMDGTAQDNLVIDRYRDEEKVYAIHTICGSNWTGSSPVEAKTKMITDELDRLCV